MEKAERLETKDPLGEVFASTLLGSDKFIAWAKETFIDQSTADTRNIPVLKEMIDKPSLNEIHQAVESILEEDHPLRRNLAIFMSHQYSGFPLKQIGAYYSMRGSAISQSSRTTKQKVSQDGELRKTVAEIARQLRLCWMLIPDSR